MSEIKPVYQLRVRFNLWEDQTKKQYEDSKFGDGVPRILYPAAAYEALQARIKELEGKELIKSAAEAARENWALHEKVEALQKEVTHWKANHADLKERLHVATHRTDLPSDRLPLFDKMKAEIAALQKENAELKKTQFKRMLRDPEDVIEYVDGYYVDLDEVYCDIEKDTNGKWSVYFRDRITNKNAWGDQVDVEALKAEKEAQAKRIAELEKCVEILQRPLDDEIISRIIVLVKNVSDEELASNVFESVRNMTNWNKSTPAEFLVLFDQTAA